MPQYTLQCGTLLILIILNMWTILRLLLSSHHLRVSSPLLQAVSAPCEIHKNANVEVRTMFHIYFVSTWGWPVLLPVKKLLHSKCFSNHGQRISTNTNKWNLLSSVPTLELIQLHALIWGMHTKQKIVAWLHHICKSHEQQWVDAHGCQSTEQKCQIHHHPQTLNCQKWLGDISSSTHHSSQ